MNVRDCRGRTSRLWAPKGGNGIFLLRKGGSLGPKTLERSMPSDTLRKGGMHYWLLGICLEKHICNPKMMSGKKNDRTACWREVTPLQLITVPLIWKQVSPFPPPSVPGRVRHDGISKSAAARGDVRGSLLLQFSSFGGLPQLLTGRREQGRRRYNWGTSPNFQV